MTETTERDTVGRGNPLKRIYDWLLGWAGTPYGGVVLGAWAFAESSFFPIPPDAFLIAMVLAARRHAFGFALVASVTSVLGGIAGYGIGHFLWWSGPGQFSDVARFFFAHVPGFDVAQFERVRQLYVDWSFWVVFTAGFTPIPYKLITISAGAFEIPFVVFTVASLVGRAARFYLVAALLWRFGAPVREFIDRRFNLLSVLFVVLLIAGFYVAKVAFR
ncbi:MAG: YqaA family protein [Candidatus Latescibacterota bacterium]